MMISFVVMGCGNASNTKMNKDTSIEVDLETVDNSTDDLLNEDIDDNVFEKETVDKSDNKQELINDIKDGVSDAINDFEDSLVNYNEGYVYSSSGKYYYVKDIDKDKGQEIVDPNMPEYGSTGPVFFSKEGNSIYFFSYTEDNCGLLNRVGINQITGQLDNKVERIADGARTYNNVYMDNAAFYADSMSRLCYYDGHDEHILASEIDFMATESDGYFFYSTGDGNCCYLCDVKDPFNPILLNNNVESYYLSYNHDYEPIYSPIYFETKDGGVYASYDYKEAIKIVGRNDYVAFRGMKDKAFILKEEEQSLDLRDYLSDESRAILDNTDDSLEYNLYSFYEFSFADNELRLLFDGVTEPEVAYGVYANFSDDGVIPSTSSISFIQKKEFTEKMIRLEDTEEYKKHKSYCSIRNAVDEWKHSNIMRSYISYGNNECTCIDIPLNQDEDLNTAWNFYVYDNKIIYLSNENELKQTEYDNDSEDYYSRKVASDVERFIAAGNGKVYFTEYTPIGLYDAIESLAIYDGDSVQPSVEIADSIRMYDDGNILSIYIRYNSEDDYYSYNPSSYFFTMYYSDGKTYNSPLDLSRYIIKNEEEFYYIWNGELHYVNARKDTDKKIKDDVKSLTYHNIPEYEKGYKDVFSELY